MHPLFSLETRPPYTYNTRTLSRTPTHPPIPTHTHPHTRAWQGCVLARPPRRRAHAHTHTYSHTHAPMPVPHAACAHFFPFWTASVSKHTPYLGACPVRPPALCPRRAGVGVWRQRGGRAGGREPGRRSSSSARHACQQALAAAAYPYARRPPRSEHAAAAPASAPAARSRCLPGAPPGSAPTPAAGRPRGVRRCGAHARHGKPSLSCARHRARARTGGRPAAGAAARPTPRPTLPGPSSNCALAGLGAPPNSGRGAPGRRPGPHHRPLNSETVACGRALPRVGVPPGRRRRPPPRTPLTHACARPERVSRARAAAR
ncbi:MAG: hypothetical protein J3K34DRAFT_436126, partial [Monoraphidium minutum]